MLHTLMFGATAAVALAPMDFAQQARFATAAEARAMLDKAVAAVKADKAKALDMFNKGEGGFRDRDLYPFCFQVSDGKIVANEYAKVLGIDVRTIKNTSGAPFGQDIYAAAKAEGQVVEVNYMFPQPGNEATLVPKVSYVTKVGDLGCGVGYYK